MRKDRISDELISLNMYMENDIGINEIVSEHYLKNSSYYYPHNFYEDKDGSLLSYDAKLEIWRWKKTMPFYKRCKLCSVQHMYKSHMLNKKDMYKEIYVNKGMYNHKIIV